MLLKLRHFSHGIRTGQDSTMGVMIMTETMITTEPVKKPAIDEEDKIAIGQKLGAVLRKYSNSRQLREAQIPVTLTVFEKLSKGSSKGNILELAGIVEGIDFTQNRVVLEGRRVKLGEIVKVSVPSRFEEEDDYNSDSFEYEYAASDMQPEWNYQNQQRQSVTHFGNETAFADEVPGYYGDRRYGYAEDSFDDFFLDEAPDYEAEVTLRQKEPPASKRPRKTILYTAKAGYRQPYAVRA